MAVRATQASSVKGLVFKKIVKEEDSNVPGALGVYMAYIVASLTPAATSTAGAEQTFTGGDLADLDTADVVFVSPPADLGSNVRIDSVRVSAAGTLAIRFAAQTGTPTPPSGNYLIGVLRIG